MSRQNKTKIARKDDGSFYIERIDPHDNDTYQQGLLEATSFLVPLFEKAKEADEYNFLLTLLRVKGVEDAGWDTLDTVRDVYKSHIEIREILIHRGMAHAFQALFTYGIIVDALEPYEVITNLLNIINGQQYSIQNYSFYNSQGRYSPPKTSAILDQIVSKAKKAGLDAAFLQRMYDNKLRNAVFHSDFIANSFYLRSRSLQREYSEKEVLSLLNRANAYIEVFFRAYDDNKLMYSDPSPIELTIPGRGKEAAIPIIREGEGVIALKDAHTEEELEKGAIPWFIGKHTRREAILIERGVYFLPNTTERINKIIRMLPHSMRCLAVRIIRKYIYKD